jgi:hypothetical protein
MTLIDAMQAAGLSGDHADTKAMSATEYGMREDLAQGLYEHERDSEEG